MAVGPSLFICNIIRVYCTIIIVSMKDESKILDGVYSGSRSSKLLLTTSGYCSYNAAVGTHSLHAHTYTCTSIAFWKENTVMYKSTTTKATRLQSTGRGKSIQHCNPKMWSIRSFSCVLPFPLYHIHMYSNKLSKSLDPVMNSQLSNTHE